MARRRPADRLAHLIEAAAKVFTAQGYRRTQMADIARAMGVAPGTLYLYVEGKEALFHLLVQCGFRAAGGVPAVSLPVRTPAPGTTLRLLRARMAAETRRPCLQAALRRRTVPDPRAELEGVVRELYATVARNHRAIRLLERSALDWPELAELFYREMRRESVDRLTAYLERRSTQRLLRAIPHPAAAARLINETVAWFAMHRHGDQDSNGITDEMAEATVVDALVNAYAKE